MPQVHKGSFFGLPDFGVTEFISDRLGRQRDSQGGSTLFGSKLSKAATLGAQTSEPATVQGPPPGYQAPSTSTSGGTYSAQPSGSIAPATSGQASDGGGGGYDALAALRNAFNSQRSALEGNLQPLESDYNLAKGDIEASVGRAKDTLTTQKADVERSYGQNLRSLLQTDKELKQRRQGTFSALGSLDSSAYRDDVTKGDQQLLESQQMLSGERDRNIQGADKEYAAYEQKATGELARVANEFTRAKQALRQAVADVNMNEAASIQNYMQQLQDRAQAVQDQMNAFKMNLAQLQAQGTDVVGNLQNFNMNNFSQQFGQGLQQRLSDVTARYSLPQQAAAGSGYINPKTGKSFTDEERRLLGI